MSWKDKLRKASFRGVEFWWEDVDSTFGRRIVTHEYPQRDGGWAEDLGRKPAEFSITGYVLGADYLSARDALEGACAAAGAGTLVHPTRGEIRVVCKECTVRESTREGGMARFDLKFVEEGDNRYPESRPDKAQQVPIHVIAAAEVVTDDFAEEWDTLGLDILELDAIAALGELVAEIEDAFAGPLALVRNAQGKLALLSRLINDPLSMVRGPRELAAALMGLFSSLGSLGGFGTAERRRSHAMAGLASLIRTANTTAPAGFAGNAGNGGAARQEVNRAALDALMARGAAVAAAGVAAKAAFDSRDDAIATRDQVVRLLDEVRTDPAAAGPVFEALTDLRAAVVADIGARAGDLARLRRVETGDTLPAAVVAYRELGDAARAPELLARNRPLIRNPLFVPAHTVLEVLDA